MKTWPAPRLEIALNDGTTLTYRPRRRIDRAAFEADADRLAAEYRDQGFTVQVVRRARAKAAKEPT